MVHELANEFDLNNKSLGKTKRLKHDTTTLYNKNTSSARFLCFSVSK